MTLYDGVLWRSTGKAQHWGATICCPHIVIIIRRKGSRYAVTENSVLKELWLLINTDKNALSWGHWFSLLCVVPLRPIFPSVFWKHKSRWAASSGCGTRLCSSNMFTWSGDGSGKVAGETSPKGLQSYTSTWCSLAWFLQQEASHLLWRAPPWPLRIGPMEKSLLFSLLDAQKEGKIQEISPHRTLVILLIELPDSGQAQDTKPIWLVITVLALDVMCTFTKIWLLSRRKHLLSSFPGGAPTWAKLFWDWQG